MLQRGCHFLHNHGSYFCNEIKTKQGNSPEVPSLKSVFSCERSTRPTQVAFQSACFFFAQQWLFCANGTLCRELKIAGYDLPGN
jgi:hypothetical protein